MSGNSSIINTNPTYAKSKSRKSTPSRNHSGSVSQVQLHRPSNADIEANKYNFLANFKKIQRNTQYGGSFNQIASDVNTSLDKQGNQFIKRKQEKERIKKENQKFMHRLIGQKPGVLTAERLSSAEGERQKILQMRAVVKKKESFQAYNNQFTPSGDGGYFNTVNHQ